MKQLVQQQSDEILHSLSGRGQYQLHNCYQHLQDTPTDWIKMNPEQRKGVTKCFDNAALHPQATLSVSCCSEFDPSQPCCSYTSPGDSTKHLSVWCEGSDIHNIPFVTSMWMKAEDYLNSPLDIVCAPGNDRKARMVPSKSTYHSTSCEESFIIWIACL